MYLYAISNYDIADALVAGDKPTLLDFVIHKDYLNVEPLAIVALALAKVKNILLATQNSGKTAAELGMSDKQFGFLKRNYSKFPQERLHTLIRFLSNIDYKLKNGLLDMPKSLQLDYIISNMLG